jgi:pilus assembly protein Flp/PilA
MQEANYGLQEQSNFYHQTLRMSALPIFVRSLGLRRVVWRTDRKPWNMKKILKDFIADESGATAIEYGLIAAGISLAIIAVVNGLGTKLNTKFTAINNSLK